MSNGFMRFKNYLKMLTIYNPINSIAVTIGGYYFAQVIGALVLIFLAIYMGWSLETIPDKIEGSVAIGLVISLVIYLTHLAIIKWFLAINKKSFKSIGLKLPKEKWQVLFYALIGFVVYFILIILVNFLTKRFLPSVDFDQKQQLGFDNYAAGFGLVGIFISLVVLPPIVEEIITRGFLYTGLRTKLDVRWSGLIVGVIFGSAHLQWGSGAPLLWTAFIDTFVLSCVLVYVREKSGSLYPAIGIHMIKNLLAFLALFIFHLA